jgi:phosphonoacetate hydrolase
MAEEGFFKQVNAVLPTVTNVNNVSICCGAYPDQHAITGNSYFNEQIGEADYMESAAFLRAPTVIQRAAERGIASTLLTCKKKTLNLLATRPDLGMLYVHTTDYPMHAWAPGEAESREHLSILDGLLGQAVSAAPDAAFLLTADHGMNYKTRCWDLEKACAARGVPLRFALSAEKDRYVRHHRTFGGTAWVWLHGQDDAERAAATISDLGGVEQVLSRGEAAVRFHLMPERIGDLMVLGDRDTVFGELPTPREQLDARYRSHGSLHEQAVPLVIYNHPGDVPPTWTIAANLDLTRTLYRD